MLTKNYGLRVVAIFEIIGGGLGLVSTIVYLLKVPLNYDLLNTLLSFYIILFYMLNLFSGIVLILEKKIGYYLSILSNVLQIVGVNIFGLIYILSSLVFLFVTYDSASGVELEFLFGGRSLISYKETLNSFIIGINIVPIFLLIILIKSWKNQVD